MKKTLSILLLAVVAKSMSAATVGHTGKYFTVTESDRSYRVGRESLDNTLRNINSSNLALFLQKGRISANKLNDGSYMLRGHVNGLGGGPLLASFSYWCVKSLCWGGIAAAGAGVVATGVGAGVALAGGGGAAATAGGLAAGTAKMGIGLGIKAVADTAVVSGAGVIATGIGATATGTAMASTGTVAVVTASAGTSLGVLGTIEALCLAAYAGALALPTP